MGYYPGTREKNTLARRSQIDFFFWRKNPDKFFIVHPTNDVYTTTLKMSQRTTRKAGRDQHLCVISIRLEPVF